MATTYKKVELAANIAIVIEKVGLIVLMLFVSPSALAAQTFVVLPAALRDSLTISPQLPVGRVAILEKFMLLVCSLLFLFVAVKKKRRIQPLTYITLGTVATVCSAKRMAIDIQFTRSRELPTLRKLPVQAGSTE